MSTTYDERYNQALKAATELFEGDKEKAKDWLHPPEWPDGKQLFLVYLAVHMPEL